MALDRLSPAVSALVLAAFLSAGLLGAKSYLDNFLTYRGFAPPREPAFVSQPGALQRIVVPSAALGGRRQETYVYLPTGYAQHPTRRYPVLYLLHGFPGRPLAFIQTVQMGIVDDTLATLGAAQPVILVMPFGSTGTFNDEEWTDSARPGAKWGTFVARDLVRAIDSRYRTIASRSGRAIGGLSAGGYGAIDIVLHHPREFAVVESWSGYMRPYPIRSVYGPELGLLATNDPRLLLPRAAPVLRRLHTYFWFYSGLTDPLRGQNEAFAHELSMLGIPYRYRVVYGGHTWAIWRNNARAAFIASASRLAHG